MILGSKEKEWADLAWQFVMAELKRANVSYHELAQRLKEHGLEEAEASTANKLSQEHLRPPSFWRQ